MSEDQTTYDSSLYSPRTLSEIKKTKVLFPVSETDLEEIADNDPRAAKTIRLPRPPGDTKVYPLRDDHYEKGITTTYNILLFNSGLPDHKINILPPY